MPTIELKQRSLKPKNRTMSENVQQAAYYNTTRWKRIRETKLMQCPVCQECRKNLAECVHHIIPFMSFNKDSQRRILAFNYKNLLSLCNKCHEKIHRNMKNEKK